MMKPLKISLRVWIAMTSLLSFLGGWALFAHSGKPAPLISSAAPADTTASTDSVLAPLPTLPAIPSLDQLATSGQVQALQVQQPNFSANVTPRLRTRGS